MRGLKPVHRLDINDTTELLELHYYYDLDFELGPEPHNYLKLK
jgi:hypothetical protein